MPAIFMTSWLPVAGADLALHAAAVALIIVVGWLSHGGALRHRLLTMLTALLWSVYAVYGIRTGQPFVVSAAVLAAAVGSFLYPAVWLRIPVRATAPAAASDPAGSSLVPAPNLEMRIGVLVLWAFLFLYGIVAGVLQRFP